MKKYLLAAALLAPSCDQIQRVTQTSPPDYALWIADGAAWAHRQRVNLPAEVTRDKFVPKGTVSSDPPYITTPVIPKGVEEPTIEPPAEATQRENDEFERERIRNLEEHNNDLRDEIRAYRDSGSPPRELQQPEEPAKSPSEGEFPPLKLEKSEGKSSGVVKAAPKRFLTLYKPNFFCPTCEMVSGEWDKLVQKGYKRDQLRIVRNHRGFQKYPVVTLTDGDEEISRWTGLVTESQGYRYLTQLTPKELRRKVANWSGKRVGVEPKTWQSYVNHITDKSQHGGRAYESWQLQGLSLDELEKVHSLQHQGVKYGVP